MNQKGNIFVTFETFTIDTMRPIFNIVLLIFIDVSLGAKTSVTKTVKTKEDALAWLNKYGYNPCDNTGVQCSISLPSLIEDYQQRFGLKKSGILDEKTKKHMSRPRCGNKDKPESASTRLASLQQYKWSRLALTYSIRGYPTQISQTSTQQIIRDAFNAWLAYVPMEIKAVCETCDANFVINFVREDHMDSYPFDGPSGTLAHAFFPEDGRVHFDKDEQWTERLD